MDLNVSVTWCIILSIRYSRQFWLLKIIKKYEAVDDNLPVRIYVNKIENITFKIKIGYYVELFSPETMKLLESTKSNIPKDEWNLI